MAKIAVETTRAVDHCSGFLLRGAMHRDGAAWTGIGANAARDATTRTNDRSCRDNPIERIILAPDFLMEGRNPVGDVGQISVVPDGLKRSVEREKLATNRGDRAPDLDRVKSDNARAGAIEREGILPENEQARMSRLSRRGGS